MSRTRPEIAFTTAVKQSSRTHDLSFRCRLVPRSEEALRYTYGRATVRHHRPETEASRDLTSEQWSWIRNTGKYLMSAVASTQESLNVSNSPGLTQSRVAIVLVNWNGWRECIECIDSLLPQNHEN